MSVDRETIIKTTLKYFMLVSPWLLAFVLLLVIQQAEEPLRNAYGYAQNGTTPTPGAESHVRDRVSIMVILEIFALTLIVRPWDFPWRVGRFLLAEVVFLMWGSVIVAMSMHMGALMAYHALGIMVLLGLFLPICVIVLFMRDLLIEGDTSE